MPAVRLRAAGEDFLAIGCEPSLVVDGGGGAGDRQGIAVVGVFDFFELLDEVRLGDDVAETEAGESVGFAEGARDENLVGLVDQ